MVKGICDFTAAFPLVTLTRSEIGNGGSQEAIAAEDLFEGKTWLDVRSIDIRASLNGGVVLMDLPCFMSPSALRAFLPSLLLACAESEFFEPLHWTLRRMLQDQEIGDLSAVQKQCLTGFYLRLKGEAPWLRDVESEIDALLDVLTRGARGQG